MIFQTLHDVVKLTLIVREYPATSLIPTFWSISINTYFAGTKSETSNHVHELPVELLKITGGVDREVTLYEVAPTAEELNRNLGI